MAAPAAKLAAGALEGDVAEPHQKIARIGERGVTALLAEHPELAARFEGITEALDRPVPVPRHDGSLPRVILFCSSERRRAAEDQVVSGDRDTPVSCSA